MADKLSVLWQLRVTLFTRSPVDLLGFGIQTLRIRIPFARFTV